MGDSLASVSNSSIQKNEFYKKASENYFLALAIDDSIGNKSGVARHLGNLGELYITQKKYGDAERSLLKALKISKEIGALNIVKDEHQTLSELYSLQKDPARA